MYMLRLRRREVMVSSTLLWQKLLRDREANAPWQKLRRNLLLILQLLILGALALALARPFLPVPTVVSGSVVVLLDASASMQATDVAPNRFQVAKNEVEQLINQLSGNSQMTLIWVGQTPTVLAAATNDRATLRTALAQTAPDTTAADWSAAFALATGAAQGFQNAHVVVISDGGLPQDLPTLPAELVYIPIGQSGENLALSALATRKTETGIQLFASVSNEGMVDRQSLLSLHLGNTLFDSRRITVPAGNTANITWELPPETAVLTATLTTDEQDYLPQDNIAWAVHDGGVNNRVLLVTEGNLFLERIYSVLPGVEVFKAAPGSDLTAESFDLYIFDNTPLPTPPPAADLFIINPQAGETADLLDVTGAFSNTVAIRLADSPLLQFVDWRNVHIQQAQQVAAPWAQPLVQAEGGPLLLIGEQNGHRVAVFTFALEASDLPLQIAFPILMANLTSWLNPGQAFDTAASLQPGSPVPLVPAASTTAVFVTKPDGIAWTAEVGQGDLLFAETQQLGLYHVALQDNTDTRAAGTFAVNLFNPLESHIQPANNLAIGQTAVETATAEENIGQRELWHWLLAIAFAILLVEWWVHHRGAQLPKWTFNRKS